MELTVGDVWWAVPDPAIGREQGGRRPLVVVSGRFFNDMANTLALTVPVTSRDRRWDNHVLLEGPHGLGRDSWAMTEQVRAVSRERLVRRAGIVSSACLDEMLWWLRAYLE